MFDTRFAFKPGKMTILLDGGAGSSGKGKLASFIAENADNWQFCCNTFMSNAAHWVETDDGARYLFQAFNSVAHLKDKYEKMYISGGAVLELPALLREIEEHNIKPKQLGIHPLVSIVQQKDIDYERGICNFDGDMFENVVQSDCMKLGSTLHGVGAARARRILRRSDVLLARDVAELKDFICWTDHEMMGRLDQGQAGLLEIAQGYQLGYLNKFYPMCTSRNCSVAAGLDDCGLPPNIVGDIFINFRTYPIRVNSNKWVHIKTNKILTSNEINEMKENNQEHLIKIFEGDSGGCYDDQKEITWEQITKDSGINKINQNREIREETSLTKLERRVYTFSKQNMIDAVRFNRGPHTTYLSINFINYIDAKLEGVRGVGLDKLTDKAAQWISENILELNRLQKRQFGGATLKMLGTGPKTNDMILI